MMVPCSFIWMVVVFSQSWQKKTDRDGGSFFFFPTPRLFFSYLSISGDKWLNEAFIVAQWGVTVPRLTWCKPYCFEEVGERGRGREGEEERERESERECFSELKSLPVYHLYTLLLPIPASYCCCCRCCCCCCCEETPLHPSPKTLTSERHIFPQPENRRLMIIGKSTLNKKHSFMKHLYQLIYVSFCAYGLDFSA